MCFQILLSHHCSPTFVILPIYISYQIHNLEEWILSEDKLIPLAFFKDAYVLEFLTSTKTASIKKPFHGEHPETVPTSIGRE